MEGEPLSWTAVRSCAGDFTLAKRCFSEAKDPKTGRFQDFVDLSMTPVP